VYPSGKEMVEEYSLYTEEIVYRKVKVIKMSGKEEWIYEIGEEGGKTTSKGETNFTIGESNSNVKI
jgi:hypothetical protein